MRNETLIQEGLEPYYVASLEEMGVYIDRFSLKALEIRIKAREEYSSPHAFSDALKDGADISVIAEHKRMSPTEEFYLGSNCFDTCEEYQKGGASALSILTQPRYFGGTIEDLTRAAASSALPILQKDFIDSEYQLYHAAAMGADAVLLIVAGLEDERLQTLHTEAASIGLECLVEVHSEPELERALEVGATIIGANNRDLVTGEIDLSVAQSLITCDGIDKSIVFVAESGYDVNDPQHIRDLRNMEVDGVLIGRSLMRADDPAYALEQWLATDQPE
jgi:indole-3-glycerol phosphate synthase